LNFFEKNSNYEVNRAYPNFQEAQSGLFGLLELSLLQFFQCLNEWMDAKKFSNRNKFC